MSLVLLYPAGYDEIGVDLVLVLLGSGVRFLDNLDIELVGLERTNMVEAPDVTHRRHRVLK